MTLYMTVYTFLITYLLMIFSFISLGIYLKGQHTFMWFYRNWYIKYLDCYSGVVVLFSNNPFSSRSARLFISLGYKLYMLPKTIFFFFLYNNYFGKSNSVPDFTILCQLYFFCSIFATSPYYRRLTTDLNC